jgi:hypothetical protein
MNQKVLGTHGYRTNVKGFIGACGCKKEENQECD